MTGRENSYFKSSFFRKLFLSYALLILVFVGAYSVWYISSYRDAYRASAREACRQKASAFGTETDRELLIAQSLCSAINASDSFRGLHQSLYIEKKPVDSMQLYRVMLELKRIKGASASPDVYSVMLGFRDDNRLFAPGAVIAVEGGIKLPAVSPYIGVTSAAELLGLRGSANIAVNKQFLIYAEAYTGPSGGSDKGVILTLMDFSGLLSRVEALSPMIGGVEIRNGRSVIFSSGAFSEDGESIQVDSLTSGSVTYRLEIAGQALQPPLSLGAFVPLGLTMLAGAVILFLSYWYLRRRYKPIGDISQMVGGETEGKGRRDELGGIMRGIADLIGERNGYREKMITLSPYASHGALYQLLSGNMRDAQLDVLREEQFLELRHSYFMVGRLNLALASGAGGAEGAIERRFLDARALAAHACAEFSDEERTVVCCPKDMQSLYVVLNGNQSERMGDLFYQMLDKAQEAIDEPQFLLTIGVSALHTELDALPAACQEADQALENMLTGGRGSVYFMEPAFDRADKEYDFPKEAQKRIVRDLKESNLDDLNALLDGLWEKNVRRAALAPETLRRMVEELHVCISAALREISEKSTTHLRIDRFPEPATIEEIFGYYRKLLSQAVVTYQQEVAGDESSAALEKDICQYINDNLFNPDLSLSAVADHFGVSGKMVGNVCKNCFGKTYLQYVRDCQIQRAIHLLQTTDLPLESIAEQCGFTNLLTFRRNFKAAMNMNPSDFRK